ncbi:MAG: hypothetical protein HY895_09725 [Deltaproteobacteria bacterium]|nr:hypothetical protein [Deltaproteobacteria bacterium]
MEPVVFPRHVTPVTRADRVKRAKPREDQGEGGAFAKHLHQDTEDPAEGDAAAEDDREQAAAEAPGVPGPAASTGASRPGGFGLDEAVKKAIDIRV